MPFKPPTPGPSVPPTQRHPSSAANIVLIGFMGSGKTTVGQLLAQKREWQFVDTDEMVVQTARRDIPTLFATEGEIGFRDREAAAIREASTGERQVIATGGGAVLRPENVEALQKTGVVVWLTARPEVAVARTQYCARERPLLVAGADDLLTHVLKMLGERGPLYQAAAHLVVDTSDRDVHAIVREIDRKAARARALQPEPACR